MRKRIVHIWDGPSGGVLTALAVVSAAFFLGALVGMLMASQVAGGGQESLTAYLESYLAAAQAGAAGRPRVSSILWETLRWPLLTFFLGFTALGVVGIPVLFAVRGFLLSFAVSSFVLMFGGVGAILAFFAFGFTGMLSVPALFVLGTQGFASGQELALRTLSGGKGSLPWRGRAYWVHGGLCAAVLGLSMLLEWWAVPALLSSVANLF